MGYGIHAPEFSEAPNFNLQDAEVMKNNLTKASKTEKWNEVKWSETLKRHGLLKMQIEHMRNIFDNA